MQASPPVALIPSARPGGETVLPIAPYLRSGDFAPLRAGSLIVASPAQAITIA
jgi:hypothetical protein